MLDLIARIVGPADALDDAAVDAASLRKTLLLSDQVASVEFGGKPHESGAKGLTVDILALVVSFTGGLPAVVTLIEKWRRTRRVGRIVLEIDGDVLELSDASQQEQRHLINAWLARRDQPLHD